MKARARGAVALRARRTWAYGIALCTAAAALGFHQSEAALGSLAGHWYRLERVEVAGVQQLRADEVARCLAVAPGEPLAELDLGVLRDRLRAHPVVTEARVTRVASTLVVRIAERQPAAALCDLDGAESGGVLVDDTGAAFAPAPRGAYPELPRICASGEIPLRLVRDALDGMRALRGVGLSVAEWRLRPALGNSAEVHLRDFTPRLILGLGDRSEQLGRLARALTFPESAAAGTIDLRFRNQVVLGPASADLDEAPAERNARVPAQSRGHPGGT